MRLFNNISELEATDPERGTDEYRCNYALGSRLFVDLYHVLGENTFRQGFRSLYLKRLQDDPTDDCEGTGLSICHLEAAFKAGASDDVAAKVDDVVGRWYYGTVPMAKVPNCAEQHPDRGDLCEPIKPPMAPAYIDWRWESGQDNFRELITDFTIHNDVGNWSDNHGYYLILIQNDISDAGFYFGLQTDANRRGKAVTFSRWGTRDLANARWDEAEGWTESAGHEGDFVGVRRAYNWGQGDYQIRLGPHELESDGEWFGLWITDLATNETTWIGSLKFPLKDSTANFRPHASATIELYGIEAIRPIDIPEWRVSVKPPLGDGMLATWGFTSYPWDDSANALFNSNVRYDSEDGAAHLIVGGTTERENTAVGYLELLP